MMSTNCQQTHEIFKTQPVDSKAWLIYETWDTVFEMLIQAMALIVSFINELCNVLDKCEDHIFGLQWRVITENQPDLIHGWLCVYQSEDQDGNRHVALLEHQFILQRSEETVHSKLGSGVRSHEWTRQLTWTREKKSRTCSFQVQQENTFRLEAGDMTKILYHGMTKNLYHDMTKNLYHDMTHFISW